MNAWHSTLLALVITTLVFSCVADARTFVSDPQNPDTVRIDSVRALRSSRVAVPVYVFSDEPLAGIEITLTSKNPSVTLDSFSFAGSVVDYLELKGAIYVDHAMTAYAFPYTDFFIYPAHGLFGRVYATISDTTASGQVIIDSTTITVETVEHSTWFSDLQLETFYPIFRSGKIDVQDSCCVASRGNIDGSADDGVDISDLTVLIAYLFIDFSVRLTCPEEADVSPDVGSTNIDISDLTTLVQYLFIDASTALPACRVLK